jgi:hypothetical protein
MSKSNVERHGLVVQKIKGAQDVKLSIRGWISGGDSLLKILNNRKFLINVDNVVECFVGKALVVF